MTIHTLEGKEILLGVTGGVAAYKSCELVRQLREKGAGVTVIMTDSATRFVTPVTFGALTGRRALVSLFDDTGANPIPHIELTFKADAFIVAPATANVIGKMASGIADDLLTTMLMAARCPVLLAPAMNCRMFDNPVLQRNIEALKGMGVRFVGPDEGPMACGEVGWGRMSEPAGIVAAAVSLLVRAGALSGKRVLVTAGPTFEDIDPVRFIGNRSSGKMGYAVAAEAGRMGASVTLVTGPTGLALPAGVESVSVRSAAEMEQAVMARAEQADIIIMAAAVADYAPIEVSLSKIKKTDAELALRLIRTPDILKKLGAGKTKGQILVGFAAETDDLEKNALIKLREKGLDLIAANPVGGETGFGSDYNILKIYGPDGLIKDTGRVTKSNAARALLDVVASVVGG